MQPRLFQRLSLTFHRFGRKGCLWAAYGPLPSGTESRACPCLLQVLLFTATMPQQVKQAAGRWLPKGALRVCIRAGADAISPTVTQVSGRLHCRALRARIACARQHEGRHPLIFSNVELQVVQVCAEHKKPAKLLKHLTAIQEAAAGLRNPPRVLVFANRIKVGWEVSWEVWTLPSGTGSF